MTSCLMEKRELLRKSTRKIRPHELETEEFAIEEKPQPIVVRENKLEIDSRIIETERVYHFNFLDTDMVLWKLKDGTIDLYQVVEEQ